MTSIVEKSGAKDQDENDLGGRRTNAKITLLKGAMDIDKSVGNVFAADEQLNGLSPEIRELLLQAQMTCRAIISDLRNEESGTEGQDPERQQMLLFDPFSK